MSGPKKVKDGVTAAPEVKIVNEIATIKGTELILRAPESLTPYPGNPRVHGERQIAALMSSMKEFGFNGVIVTNEEGMVLAGHGRLEAAKRLGLKEIPVRVAVGLSKEQQRAFVLADNKISQLSQWDEDLLKIEISSLLEANFNVETTAFSTAEIDIMLDPVLSAPEAADEGNLQPQDLGALNDTPTSRLGDLWIMGNHRLYCGSSIEIHNFGHVMNHGELAEMVITDPPYNVKIDGHVCGNGDIKHAEFAMASGEMDEGQFTDFLSTVFSHIQEFSKDGAIIYSFMDWRHEREILNAAEPVFGKLRQLCVWVKDNGGMGSFYRSQHELVYVFKNGQASHINNFELGQHGRYRTNVWSYPGVNSFKGKGHELLKLHPTVKPVSLIADAIRDCSNRKGVILDPFAGSGTILIAAERTGRHARALEIDPKYVDIAIRRWQRCTHELAVHKETGATFDELTVMRAQETEGKDV